MGRSGTTDKAVAEGAGTGVAGANVGEGATAGVGATIAAVASPSPETRVTSSADAHPRKSVMLTNAAVTPALRNLITESADSTLPSVESVPASRGVPGLTQLRAGFCKQQRPH